MSCERTKLPTLFDLSIPLRSDTFNFKSIATLTSAFTPTPISVTKKDPKLFSKLISATARGLLQTSFRQSLRFQQFIHSSVIMSKYNVIFVLGGPGAGKGTQCELIVKEFGFVHLSAGDLLRAERQRKGSKYGELIEGHITAGTIVPVEITCALLKQAMEDSGKTHFLIDGFPRNKDNLDGWNKEMSESADVKQVLFFDCKEEVCVERCLKRGETSGRSDDNKESLTKRITTYNNSTRPIIEHYDTLKLVTQLNGEKTPEDVFKDVTKALTDLKLTS